MTSSATLSDCRTWRYQLRREWDPLGKTVLFIGLNPSTADETRDDPTIRRCIAFAKQWGYGALCMVNLFAFRATNPLELRVAVDPIGPENELYISAAYVQSHIAIAAWGNHGSLKGRAAWATEKMELYCLGRNKNGSPKHPLYVPGTALPIGYSLLPLPEFK